MRILSIFGALALATCLGVQAAEPRKIHRFALVIGNRNYQGQPWSRLHSPQKDAIDVAAALEAAGYKPTVPRTNQLIGDLRPIINEFLVKVDNAKLDIQRRRAQESEAIIALFYYSGHGFVANNDLELAAVDAVGKYVEDVSGRSYKLRPLSQRLAPENDPDIELLTMFFVDACRTKLELPAKAKGAKGRTDNPAKAFAGLIGGQGQIFMYASGDGRPSYDGKNEAENSVFTRALLAALSTVDETTFISEFYRKVRNETVRISKAELGVPQVPEIREYLMSDLRFRESPAPTNVAGTPGNLERLNARASFDAIASRPFMAEKGLLGERVMARGSTLGGDDTAKGALMERLAELRGADLQRVVEVSSSPTAGWVWLGDADPKEGPEAKWKRLNVKPSGGSAAPESPAEIKKGQTYTLGSNLFIREKFPNPQLCSDAYSSRNYANCVKSVGIAQRGEEVEIVGPALKVGTGSSLQYWAPVRVHGREGK